jgi:hypothetical protein
MIDNDKFVLCQSADGWSLHAPGSTDEQIATGDARYLVTGPGEAPKPKDYRIAASLIVPWAAEIIEVEGGFMAFESVQDARTWRNQQ